MSWDKGDKNEKDVRSAEFLAAINAISGELMRFEPGAGIAAIAYMVALTRVLKPTIPFDKMIKHYEGKIREQMGDAIDIIRQLHKEAKTPKDTEELIELAQAFLKQKRTK